MEPTPPQSSARVSADVLDEHGTESDPMTGLDWTLAIIGGVGLLWLLMFATSGITRAMRNRRSRRKIFLWCIAVEAVIIAIIIYLIVR